MTDFPIATSAANEAIAQTGIKMEFLILEIAIQMEMENQIRTNVRQVLHAPTLIMMEIQISEISPAINYSFNQ